MNSKRFLEKRKREIQGAREILIIFGEENSIEEYLKENPQKEDVNVHKVFSMKHVARFINRSKAIVLPGCPEGIKMKAISNQNVTFL